jgi:O-antigen biosynthesis protein
MFVHPFSPPGAATPFGLQPIQASAPSNSKSPTETSLPRYLNFIADYTGCGHWRMLWPEHVLNSYRHCVVQSSTVMITDPKHFKGVNCVRVQRQASDTQKQYLKFLKENLKLRVIYEIDDICFGEDIPDYNPFKQHFTAEQTRRDIQEMMEMCDEMTVTCPTMRNYFLENTKQENITIIPNYLPRSWIGRMYDKKSSSAAYDKNRKKPRILYAGSSSHFDIHKKNNNIDDFTHVKDAIIKSIDKYQWIFLGGVPPSLTQYVDSGKIELHKWTHLFDYPYFVKHLNINAMVAPLADNIFNKCKSDIKYMEASAMGIPIVCQDIETYNSTCKLLFDTGDEMIEHLDSLFNNKKQFSSTIERQFNSISKMWLEQEHNRLKYHELYTYKYGTSDRVNINKVNDC